MLNTRYTRIMEFASLLSYNLYYVKYDILRCTLFYKIHRLEHSKAPHGAVLANRAP